MNKEQLQQAKCWTEQELERCVNFWLKNGMDHEYGGVYTCLDRYGKIYSTDKSVWMQGRCGWIFAYLCHVYGVKQEWLDASKSCLDFMEKYCINPEADGRMYFTVTADGKPLRQEVFNFGKHKGLPVADVLKRDPGYFSWMLGGDFTYNTKQVLTRIRLREFNSRNGLK